VTFRFIVLESISGFKQGSPDTEISNSRRNIRCNWIMGYLTNFYRDSHQEDPQKMTEKSQKQHFVRYNQPIAWKSSSKLLVTS